jgi:hypothetical protein
MASKSKPFCSSAARRAGDQDRHGCVGKLDNIDIFPSLAAPPKNQIGH